MNYNYTYGMQRPYYTIYALVDPKYPDVPRYIGLTDGNPVWRLGRHLGETWGLDSQREVNLKQRWIRAIVGKGRIPEVKAIYQTKDVDRANLAESILIKYLWDGVTNASSIGDKTYKKRKNSRDGKLVLERIHKKYKNLDPKFKDKSLPRIYPGIFKGTRYE
tara:strand:+ start:426 stop:911 length:486 start_codon:yes stop_codon:yes gene_type:complete